MEKPIANPKAMKASQVTGRIANCHRLLEEAGLSFDDWQAPIDDVEFRHQLVQFWKSRGNPAKAAIGERKTASTIFKVTVDYSRSLKEMIAAGKYDYVNPDITEKNFSVKGSGQSEVEVELVHYNKVMTSEQVLADFKKRGLKPAPIEVGLALGEEKPELQHEFLIVMLGSVRRHWPDRSVPSLWSYSGGRRLRLFYFEDRWDDFSRFLAVREV